MTLELQGGGAPLRLLIRVESQRVIHSEWDPENRVAKREAPWKIKGICFGENNIGWDLTQQIERHEECHERWICDDGSVRLVPGTVFRNKPPMSVLVTSQDRRYKVSVVLILSSTTPSARPLPFLSSHPLVFPSSCSDPFLPTSLPDK